MEDFMKIKLLIIGFMFLLSAPSKANRNGRLDDRRDTQLEQIGGFLDKEMNAYQEHIKSSARQATVVENEYQKALEQVRANLTPLLRSVHDYSEQISKAQTEYDGYVTQFQAIHAKAKKKSEEENRKFQDIETKLNHAKQSLEKISEESGTITNGKDARANAKRLVEVGDDIEKLSKELKKQNSKKDQAQSDLDNFINSKEVKKVVELRDKNRQRKTELEAKLGEARRRIEAQEYDAQESLMNLKNTRDNIKASAEKLKTEGISTENLSRMMSDAIDQKFQEGKTQKLEWDLLLSSYDHLINEMDLSAENEARIKSDISTFKIQLAQSKALNQQITNTLLGGYINHQIAQSLNNENLCPKVLACSVDGTVGSSIEVGSIVPANANDANQENDGGRRDNSETNRANENNENNENYVAEFQK
jgi:chromosome segregation ATPase